MSVHCTFCGEELLGAVNRCWRCGRRFTYAPTRESEPPVRRSPLSGPLSLRPGEAPVEAVCVEEPVAAVSLKVSSDGAFPDGVPVPVAPGDVPVELVDGPAEAARRSPAIPAASSPDPKDLDHRAGELRVVNASTTARQGSPFQDEFHIFWWRRWGLWLSRPWNDLRALGRRILGRATPGRGKPASGPTSDAPGRGRSAATEAAREELSPFRRALANAALGLSLMLGISSILLLSYPLIAAVIGMLGVGLAVLSIAARMRLVAVVVLLVSVVPLVVIGYRGYERWERANANPAPEWEEEEGP
ncbi:MAG: hypothetical protein U0935_17285 [Pirellulales bacterium]